uniref:BPL/LPL catalytic domain-containing protein n=1 Tax=Auxenochlorella protothecoides TaxID=3075 RepID=A0A1D1ZP07_AUXPR
MTAPQTPPSCWESRGARCSRGLSWVVEGPEWLGRLGGRGPPQQGMAPREDSLHSFHCRKPEVMVHEVAARKAGVTLIRRFTGGGTVVVDSDTLFTGLIMGVDEVPGLEPFPRPIMKWTEDLFKPVFGKYGDFALREHDYVFKDVKFGGNAQAISKRRFVHHTSLLWRFDPDRMALLQHPARTPEYRQGRPHHRFITPLQDHVPSRPHLLDQLTASLGSAGFALQEASLVEAEEALARNKICGTRVL